MQNNEAPTIVDISQLTWLQAGALLQEALNEDFKPGEALDLNRLWDVLSDMVAKLFEENPDIAERDMVVDYGVGSFVSGHLEKKDACALWSIPLTFSYTTCGADEDGKPETVTTEIETLTNPITIMFDLESGYHVTLDAKELYLHVLPEDACVDVLDGCSISDYVGMLEKAFIEDEKYNLHALPESVAARIAVEYCDEVGIDVNVSSEEDEEEVGVGDDTPNGD